MIAAEKGTLPFSQKEDTSASDLDRPHCGTLAFKEETQATWKAVSANVRGDL